MKINNQNTANIIRQYSSFNNSEATSNTQGTRRTSLDSKRPQQNNYESAAVKADISKEYDTYHKAIKEIKSNEIEERNTKIQNLKKQIEEGTYEVKPELIARSILDKVTG